MAPTPAQTSKARAQITQLPGYAIEYAPYLYMSQDKVDDFMRVCSIEKDDGTMIEFADGVKGKIQQLADPRCTANTYISFKRHPVLGVDTAAMAVFDCRPEICLGRSEAPIWIEQIVVDKSDILGPAYVDVYYFYFYAFNLGNSVLGKNFGNHVGDWEHNMIRFANGVPQEMHYSQHAVGVAYKWAALEKVGKRPVVYCAAGSHANYPMPGHHNYANIPFGAGPHDRCSKGLPWDVALNYVCTSYDESQELWQRFAVISPAPTTDPARIPLPPPTPMETPEPQVAVEEKQGGLTHAEIVQVLAYEGRWGNYWSRQPKSAQEQSKFGQRLRRGLGSVQVWKGLVWAAGPTGPRDKSLNRTGMMSVPHLQAKSSLY